MTKTEVDEVIQYYKKEYEEGTNYFNIFENAFNVEYDDSGKVKFIQSLNRSSQHETDGETQYIFANIGLSLWRPSVFTEETMKEDWFKEMSKENQEQEMRYFFF